VRIGIMLRHLPTETGGIGRYTKKLLQHLPTIDKSNEYFILHRDESAIGVYQKFPNVKELARPAPSKLFWDQIVIPHWAKQLSLDLIFNPKISAPLRTPCKTVIMMHGADWFEVPQSYSLPDRIYHKLAARLYSSKADAIILASHDAADKFEQHVAAARGKTVAVHHGVDGEFYRIEDDHGLSAVRDRYQLPERFILYLGQIYPMKNVSGIVAAYAQLRGKIPHKLVIAGAPGHRAERELASIARYGLEDDVVLVGRVPDEDLPPIYSLADVFVFPSLYEGFGIPLLEAMACGCPVVTSTAGSCPEVVGDAAVIVDPGNVEAIAAAVDDLLNNPSLAQTMIAKGRERARAFTWEQCARDTIAVFEQVGEQPAGKSIGRDHVIHRRVGAVRRKRTSLRLAADTGI
jgi:glycosyltransferase involved in cell wall biosynthesis